MTTGRFARQNKLSVVVCLLFLLGIQSLSAQPTVMREFPVGRFSNVEQLPPGQFRKQLEELPSPARERAVGWLKSIHFTEDDVEALRADINGGIYYVCAIEKFTVPVEPAPTTGAAAAPVSPFPSHLLFHSKPGAANVLYLNFAGETVINTEWNTVVGRSEIPAVAFSTDTDLTTFSDAEQQAIKRIWQRVAEDYAAFNIDVTTERPSSLSSKTAHALITRTTDADGYLNPSADVAGGIAYVNVFGTLSYSKYRPAWIYHNNLANEESYVAEAASHEIGHNMGLTHDGKSDGSDYYGGHGSGDISWGPLMGTGYNRNVSQWSKGEYYLANNTQDDLATVAGKVSYAADDHGSTAGTATALVITGGTNVVSTTPENDPTNANKANKGILERNTDVDVFSLVTGTGTVELNVQPWVVPSAITRGGNLDIRMELYSEAGSLVAANNPDSATSAQIRTNLSEGRYYLHVKNSGAGTPLSSNPSGYTSYGSVGQFFIHGTVVESTGFVVAPVAELKAPDLTQAGTGSHEFTVTYSDDVAVRVSTIDGSDIRVTGPNGYDRIAQFLAVDIATDGTPRVARYAVSPPTGSSWLPGHNGSYSVWIQSSQVGDVEGAWVAAGKLGEFKVALPSVIYSAYMNVNPGWSLEPEWAYGVPSYSSTGPTGGHTGTSIVGYNLSGDYGNRLSAKYATTPTIDCSGSSAVTLRFSRWLRMRPSDNASIEVSTDGSSWQNVWSSSSAVSDTAWQEVRYTLPAGVAGKSTVRLRWGISSNPAQSDIGWNIDDVELLADGALDSAPPSSTLSVANISTGGSPSHSCTVLYTDDTAVRLASLGPSDLVVTGPNAYSDIVEFAGADLPGDGSPCTASYSITAPGGTWDAADNGTYSVTLQEGEVVDVNNNAVVQKLLGSFTVDISTSTPDLLVVSPSGGLSSSGPVGGPFSPSSITYTLSNSGGTTLNWTAAKAQSWVSLSATSGSLAPGASTTVSVSLNANADSLAAGSYSDSVAFVNATTGNGNTTRAVALTVSSQGILAVSPSGGLSSSGPVGGPFSPSSITYTLSNSGGTTLDWSAAKAQSWVSLSTTSGSLAPGASTTVVVSLNANADSLAAGSYGDTVIFINKTMGSGDTTRSVTLTLASEYKLLATVNRPEWGSLEPDPTGVYGAGTAVQLVAKAAPYFQFDAWQGDVVETNNPLIVIVEKDMTVHAIFSELLTTNYPTPYWWLAAHGVTNDLETAVLSCGANKIPLWQSYIAGLNPNDPESQLRLWSEVVSGETNQRLRWNPVEGRFYTICSSSDPISSFQPVQGAIRLPATVSAFTNDVSAVVTPMFYRIGVERQ